MTDAVVEARGRTAWLWGGVLLVVTAAVDLLLARLLLPGVGWAHLARDAVYGAALLLFAFGLRGGAGSVVGRRPVGVAALVTLALWPFISSVVWSLIPISSEAALPLTILGYGMLLVPLAAAIVAVVEIARARVVPSPWHRAPAVALAILVGTQVIVQLGMTAGRSDQTFAALWAGLIELSGLLATAGLGIIAIVLALLPARSTTVPVFPESSS